MAKAADHRKEELLVMIAGAHGLRNADWSPFTQDKSDPYCVCQVVNSPDKSIRTSTVNDSLDPVWNHVAKMPNYQPGEALNFIVWDFDTGKKDDKLGHARLESTAFMPHGFVGRLFLQGAGNNTAAIYVMILPLPILSGQLDVMRMRSLEPRYFCLTEDALLYFTDGEDYETGLPERGSIMLKDVQSFEVDKNATLVFYIYRLPHPIQVHCRTWEEAARWGAAVDRTLLLQGVSNEKELSKYTQASVCEGFCRFEGEGLEGPGIEGMDGSSAEEPVYVALLADMVVGYKDFYTFRHDSRSSLFAESVSTITHVEAVSSECIRINMGGKAIKLYTNETEGPLKWEDTMRWGRGFLQVSEPVSFDQDPQDKSLHIRPKAMQVDAQSFAKLIVYQGSLNIIRGTGELTRYFVMYGDRMEYFNSKEDFEKQGKQHGRVQFENVTKVICGNEVTLTIKLENGTVFQLKEITPGSGVIWADCWDKILKVKGKPAVIRFDWGGPSFNWDFLVKDE